MPDYFLGLSLGQANDFTALAVVERLLYTPHGVALDEPTYNVRHLQRFAPGTPYGEIVPAVTGVAAEPPLRGNATLVVDRTAVGKAVVDRLRAAFPGEVRSASVTAGLAVSFAEDGSLLVPRKELVTSLQLLLQDRRLRVARELPEADTLVRELASFQAKVPTVPSDALAAWREGPHDDLVLAAALACWQGEREPRWHGEPFAFGGWRNPLRDLRGY